MGLSEKLQLPTTDAALPDRAERMTVPERHYVSGAPLQPPFPANMEVAVCALGCFWGAERKYWRREGIFTPAVGYAGGVTPNPSYDEVCFGGTGVTCDMPALVKAH